MVILGAGISHGKLNLSTMKHPVQKLCIIPSKEGDILLAASGAGLNAISLTEGQLLCQWPTDLDNGDDENGRPHKRRKIESREQSLSRQQSEASDASIEIVAERKKGERKKSKLIDTKLPGISHLLATSDGRFAVSVTAEDKTIRVFEVTNRKLSQISQRALPKKLCAIRFTKDEKTILAADKFGDVYAIPLHQSDEWAPRVKLPDEASYMPAATALTVHTKGNLEALRQQLTLTERKAKKEGPDFECQLLLGHVSLLTDLAVGEGIVDGRPRPYILTSDRDEHIRVSRGMPQAHVIESFCLGHLEFVTRLCIPPSRPELLIAGNGEPSLRIYAWQTGQLLQTLQIGPDRLSLENDGINSSPEPVLVLPEGRSPEKLAVSGIWPMNVSGITNPDVSNESLILVAVEGIPLLLTYVLRPNGLAKSGSIKLQGNVLDVIVLEAKHQILISIDNVHEPYSMKAYVDDNIVQKSPFQLLQLYKEEGLTTSGNAFRWESADLPFDSSEIIQTLPAAPDLSSEDNNLKSKSYEKTFSNLGEFLYGLENLRKKRDVTIEEEEGMEEENGDVPKPEMKVET